MMPSWLRYSHDWNRKPEIRALDDESYRALLCLIEAAENFGACGMAPDNYVLTTYPYARQKLRRKVRKLADRGLVHLLSGPEERDHDCVSCQTRWEELRGEVGEELREKWGTSSTTSAQSRKTKPMWLCIRYFYDHAMTPERKRQTKQGNAKRQRDKRKKDKAAASRRDALPPSHPSVSVAVADNIINDPTPPPNDPAPDSTASPSEPSDLVQWLREKLAAGRKHVGCKQPKWKDEHRELLEAVVRKALEAPGDTVAILNGALDGFIADPTQREFRYSPHGLAHGFDTYAEAVLEEQVEAYNARKRVEQDKKLAAGDKLIFERDEREKARRRAEREENGAAPGGFIAAELKGLLK